MEPGGGLWMQGGRGVQSGQELYGKAKAFCFTYVKFKAISEINFKI